MNFSFPFCHFGGCNTWKKMIFRSTRTSYLIFVHPPVRDNSFFSMIFSSFSFSVVLFLRIKVFSFSKYFPPFTSPPQKKIFFLSKQFPPPFFVLLQKKSITFRPSFVLHLHRCLRRHLRIVSFNGKFFFFYFGQTVLRFLGEIFFLFGQTLEICRD